MDPSTAQDPIQLATTIFNALFGRVADRYKAIELLNDPACRIDLATLRTLLIKAIKHDFYVGREKVEKDDSIARTRSWLLGALARIASGDDAATDLVVSHVNKKVEPHDWSRYWSLEGLIVGRNPKAEEVARAFAPNHHDPMIAMLATAFLGSLNDHEAIARIEQALDKADNQWFVLRALRVVPLPATVSALCTIVEEAKSADATYDAIVALGRIPSAWSHAAAAAQALAACIMKTRASRWQDSLRTAAIASLGNLRIESYGPLLIEELADDNPAIVREAARSMERILGLPSCVVRIVEAAGNSGAAATDAYGRALRWLSREEVAEELETLMFIGPAKQQDVARTLLSELGGTVAFQKLRARTDVMRQYSDVLEKAEEKIRQLFEASVREAQWGFHLAVIMDVVVFSVGCLLLLASAGFTLVAKGDLATWAGIGLAGGMGVLGIIYGVLIANPRRQVRESVDHLMRVKIVFLAYLRRLHQADQAYSRRLLDDTSITVEEVKGFSEAVRDVMRDTVQQNLHGGSDLEPLGGRPVPKARPKDATHAAGESTDVPHAAISTPLPAPAPAPKRSRHRVD